LYYHKNIWDNYHIVKLNMIHFCVYEFLDLELLMFFLVASVSMIFWACFLSTIPYCAHLFSLRLWYFVSCFQCTARKWCITLPTLAASSTSSCSSPEAMHYNYRSKRAKRSAKVRPHFFRPNSLVCHDKCCCLLVSVLRSSYPTFWFFMFRVW